MQMVKEEKKVNIYTMKVYILSKKKYNLGLIIQTNTFENKIKFSKKH